MSYGGGNVNPEMQRLVHIYVTYSTLVSRFLLSERKKKVMRTLLSAEGRLRVGIAVSGQFSQHTQQK